MSSGPLSLLLERTRFFFFLATLVGETVSSLSLERVRFFFFFPTEGIEVESLSTSEDGSVLLKMNSGKALRTLP